MADLKNLESNAEAKVVAYLDAHAGVARTAAWVFAGVQILLAALITLGSVSSIVAAAACVATSAVLVWLLVKTRPAAVATVAASA